MVAKLRMNNKIGSPINHLLIWLFAANFVHAEGRCPDGYFPIGGGNAGWEGCAPMGGNDDRSSDSTRSAPPVRRETRWGAIASGQWGGLGAVEGMSSKAEAVAAAMKECEASERGQPANCEVFTHYNQCAAYAWGHGHKEGTGASAVGSAFLVDEASEIALKGCSKNAHNCKIYYTGCSYPARVQ